MELFTRYRSCICWLLLALLAAPPVVVTAQAQDEPRAQADEEADPPKAAKNNARGRSKSRGRLPMYYAQVVTDEQREKIYELQARFQQQIEELLEEVKTLETKRDEEIAAVLSAEQQAQVAQMLADARKRRDALRRTAREIEQEEANEENANEEDQEEAEQ